MVPGMTILCPASFQELHDMLGYALTNLSGPVAVRYPRGGEGRYTGSALAPETLVQEGNDLTIMCYGTMINEALDAADMLQQQEISAEIIKLGMVTPNNFKLCLQSIEKTGKFIAVEEVCSAGCAGASVLTLAASNGIRLESSRLLNLGSGIVSHGSVKELRRDTGIDAQAITSAGLEMCSKAVDII